MTTRTVERGRTKCGQYWPELEGSLVFALPSYFLHFLDSLLEGIFEFNYLFWIHHRPALMNHQYWPEIDGIMEVYVSHFGFISSGA